MPKKRKLLTYSQLKKTSKNRYYYEYKRIIKKGKTLARLRRMNVSEYKKAFGVKNLTEDSLVGKRKLWKQMERHIDAITTDYLKREDIENRELKQSYFDSGYDIFNVKKDVPKIDTIDVKVEFREEEGQYGVIKVEDTSAKKKKNLYWIKYKSEKELKKQLDKILSKYQIDTYHTEYIGNRMYRTHLDKDFKERVEQEGIQV